MTFATVSRVCSYRAEGPGINSLVWVVLLILVHLVRSHNSVDDISNLCYFNGAYITFPYVWVLWGGCQALVVGCMSCIVHGVLVMTCTLVWLLFCACHDLYTCMVAVRCLSCCSATDSIDLECDIIIYMIYNVPALAILGIVCR